MTGRRAGLSVRIGLGYVNGVKEADVRRIVEERERGGPFGSIAELASRCAASREALERVAWAGACDRLVSGEEAARRRRALWLLGVVAPGLPLGAAASDGDQLALPLEPAPEPELRELTPWERVVADYASTKVTLREHPMELLRPQLPAGVRSSAEIESVRHGERIRTAGMVVARQRPATAKGVTFLLLEDEHGTVNIVVPVRVYERCRLPVRSEPLLIVDGRLERREGVVNLVAAGVESVERPDLPEAEVRHIEPRRAWSTEEAVGELHAALPAAHSFGRRGR